MKRTGIFSRYEPQSENLINDALLVKENTGMEIIFLRTKKGVLWHEEQTKFSEDTIKLACDADGVIIMFASDATLLNPINCAVMEIERDKAPDDLDDSQEWVYKDGAISKRVYSLAVNQAKAEEVRKSLIRNVLAEISAIQLKVQTGRVLNEAETVKLNAALNYIDDVNAIDITPAPNIDWPEIPSDVA